MVVARLGLVGPLLAVRSTMALAASKGCDKLFWDSKIIWKSRVILFDLSSHKMGHA